MTVTGLQRILWPFCLVGLWFSLAAHALLAYAVGHWRARSGIPGWRSWFRAWLREVRWAYPVFAWWQPFRTQAIPDLIHGDWADGHGPTGVVLIHGFLCNRAFWTPWLRRFLAQGRPFVALTLDGPFDGIDTHVQAVNDAVDRLARLTGRPPLIVAHSMGGLVARAWCAWARQNGGQGWRLADRVCGVITMGSPHQGTWLARFSRTDNGRQMVAGGPWLDSLAALETREDLACFESWSTDCDAVVFPAGSTTLPGAATCRLVEEGHVSMVFAPVVWASVLSHLERADKALPAVVFF